MPESSVFSFDANRGGEYETAYLRNHRAGALSDIELKKAESRDAQLQHKHPIDMGTAAVSHAQSMVPNLPRRSTILLV